MKDNTAAVHCQVPVEVASFLLNEKRSEITKIELKQRVNVIMVPNKGMDTPHYKLERLKHDDTRLETMEASYKLADEPEDVATVTRRSQEPTNKQTPVIKGVLPDAPAPIAEPRPPRQQRNAAAAPTPAAAPAPAARPVAREQGFFAWLKNLLGFGGAPAPATAPAPVAEAPAPAARDGNRDGRRSEGRGDRGGDRNRRGGERNDRGGNGERGERSDRGDRNNRRNGANRDEQQRGDRPEQQQQRQDRPERGNRRGGERGERNERRDERQPQVADAALNLNEEFNAQAPTQKPERSRQDRPERGDRAERGGDRGEGRRERQPRNADAQPVMQPVADEANQPLTQIEGNEAQGQDAQGEQAREPRQRRSRDRYGRDRRDRAPRDAQAADEQAVNAQFADQPLEVQLPAEALMQAPAVTETDDQPARRSYFDAVAPQAEQAPVATEVQATAVVAEAAVAVVTPAPVEAPAPAPAPVAAPAVVEPQAIVAAPAEAAPAAPVKAQAYQLPLQQLHELAAASGLQWINSDADKIAVVQAAIAAEPKPVHIPRERPPAVVLDEGPLILVETRKDLSLMQLPFEKEEQAAGNNA